MIFCTKEIVEGVGGKRKSQKLQLTNLNNCIDRFSCDNVGLPQANISTESRMRASRLWFYILSLAAKLTAKLACEVLII